jgi:hypothetical protein
MIAWICVWEIFMSPGATTLYANNYMYTKVHVFVFVVWINEQEMELYIMWIQVLHISSSPNQRMYICIF